MIYKDILIPETKEEAQIILTARESEIIEKDGLKRMHPKSWTEMVISKFFLDLLTNPEK